jgi:hydrogenase-4 component B
VIGALLLAGIVAVALGGALCFLRLGLRVGLGVQAIGAAAIGGAGFWALASRAELGGAFTGALRPSLGVDGLSGVFLGAVGVVAAPALVYSMRYLGRRGRDRAIGALMAVFVLTMVLVLTARDPTTLLGGWELMTLAPAGLILIARGGDALARRTVFIYLAVTHLGGVGTWIAVLLLAQAGALGGGAILLSGSGLQVGIAAAALIGMGTKAGVMPLHVWLPRAHPLAPAPISALMSGVMIKVACYLLIRVLVQWTGILPTWFGVVVVAIGALSALGGVTYALFQHELKQLLALHSIENIGIIVLGVGACLILRSRGADAWAAFALAAALLHTVNHGVFKAVLFLGAGAFEKATGTLGLDRLGGLLRAMPGTGAAFLVGSMAIAGLPPLNGFASEWLTMQALLRLAVDGGLGDGLVGAVALAVLAATAALAVVCFVKVIGLVLLGERRSGGEVREAPPSMVAPMAFLALTCVVLGVAPGPLFDALVALAPGAASPPAALGLHVPGTGGLPTVGLVVVLGAVTAILFGLRSRRAAASAPTWVCGQPVEAPLRWTSAGFTKPLRLVLEVALRPRREIVVRNAAGVTQEVSYRGHVPHLIEERIYRPIAGHALAVAAHARRLQSGRLGTYVAYLVGLVLVLLGIVRIGLLG